MKKVSHLFQAKFTTLMRRDRAKISLGSIDRLFLLRSSDSRSLQSSRAPDPTSRIPLEAIERRRRLGKLASVRRLSLMNLLALRSRARIDSSFVKLSAPVTSTIRLLARLST